MEINMKYFYSELLFFLLVCFQHRDTEATEFHRDFVLKFLLKATYSGVSKISTSITSIWFSTNITSLWN